MMNTYKDQITNLCIQTYYNLYGVMPDAQELAEMIGEGNENHPAISRNPINQGAQKPT